MALEVALVVQHGGADGAWIALLVVLVAVVPLQVAGGLEHSATLLAGDRGSRLQRGQYIESSLESLGKV